MLQFGNERILLEVIDFLDALYEAFRHAPESTDKTWLDGMRQVAKKCTDMLARHKVIEIAAVGQVFDPLRHEAVGMIPNRGEAGKVLEVMRAGYEMHNKVIRPTRVMVSS
jgi:molecular chaperone GrpE